MVIVKFYAKDLEKVYSCRFNLLKTNLNIHKKLSKEDRPVMLSVYLIKSISHSFSYFHSVFFLNTNLRIGIA